GAHLDAEATGRLFQFYAALLIVARERVESCADGRRGGAGLLVEQPCQFWQRQRRTGGQQRRLDDVTDVCIVHERSSSVPVPASSGAPASASLATTCRVRAPLAARTCSGP